MRNKIIYTSMIATIGVLLISVIVLQADAKTFDKNNEFTLKGTGISFRAANANGDIINVSVSPIIDSKEVFVDYRINHDNGVYDHGVGSCYAPKQILKVSSTSNASVEFNTADLRCPDGKTNNNTIVSVSIIGDGLLNINDKYDAYNECYTDNSGVEHCSRDKGIITTFSGIATASAFGITIPDADAYITVKNIKHTEWTNP